MIHYTICPLLIIRFLLKIFYFFMYLLFLLDSFSICSFSNLLFLFYFIILWNKLISFAFLCFCEPLHFQVSSHCKSPSQYFIFSSFVFFFFFLFPFLFLIFQNQCFFFHIPSFGFTILGNKLIPFWVFYFIFLICILVLISLLCVIFNFIFVFDFLISYLVSDFLKLIIFWDLIQSFLLNFGFRLSFSQLFLSF